MQPDCRAGLWATGGLWARPTRPIRQGKTPGLEGPLAFSLAPPPAPTTPPPFAPSVLTGGSDAPPKAR